MDCIYKCSCECPAQRRYPVIIGEADMLKGVTRGQYSRKCAIKNGLNPSSYKEEDARQKDNNDSGEEDKKPAAVVKTYIEITQEMRVCTKELGTSNLTLLPSKIQEELVHWANATYDGMWHGVKEHQVLELVRKSHTKLGLGNALSTIKNTPDYNMMTDQDRPFLHCSAVWPHPAKPKMMMGTMICANPKLLNLLKGHVDIYIDATFIPCTPSSFYQCLIIMTFDNQTSSYVPVIYARMTHKCSELYNLVFSQIAMLIQGKMKVKTYTTDFECGMMNMLALHGGTHVGCLFHLKQALLKYLKKHCSLAQASSLGGAMEVGVLDLFCVLPCGDILESGIPYVHFIIEEGIPAWEQNGWEIF